jgi:hypothetical protein
MRFEHKNMENKFENIENEFKIIGFEFEKRKRK